MKPEEPGVAIIADDPLQRQRLQQAVGKFGLVVAFIGDAPRYFRMGKTPDVDLWIVDVQDEDACDRLLDEILNNSEAPLLLGQDLAPNPTKPEYRVWERRLFAKLQEQLAGFSRPAVTGINTPPPAAPVVGVPPVTINEPSAVNPVAATTPGYTFQAGPPLHNEHQKPSSPLGEMAEEIWILGASLGGPAAVKEFLDRLPPGLPVGFVYAQHIDANFTRVLARVLGRHAHYSLIEASEGEPFRVGQVTLIPVDRELYLDSQGHMRFHKHRWPGPYGPSIDQVMLNIAQYYQTRCHAILFSGMGNDGVVAAPLLHADGSHIWVQTSESCANSSMPDSVAATGCAQFTGTPTQLANQLVQTLQAYGNNATSLCS